VPPRSNVTTQVLQKAVWAGANSGSYQQASEALAELSETRLSPQQIRRMVLQVGETRLAERDEAVEQLQATSLPRRRAGSRACDPPALAVISMDGGRYQRRDHFRSDPTQEVEGKHWRETKVGCLLSMQSEVHASDPRARAERALTYYRNNLARMNYPKYRQQGLPITSSHIESTIK
jgi:hypothetical protein